jgi:hypothetical protein
VEISWTAKNHLERFYVSQESTPQQALGHLNPFADAMSAGVAAL